MCVYVHDSSTAGLIQMWNIKTILRVIDVDIIKQLVLPVDGKSTC